MSTKVQTSWFTGCVGWACQCWVDKTWACRVSTIIHMEFFSALGCLCLHYCIQDSWTHSHTCSGMLTLTLTMLVPILTLAHMCLHLHVPTLIFILTLAHTHFPCRFEMACSVSYPVTHPVRGPQTHIRPWEFFINTALPSYKVTPLLCASCSTFLFLLKNDPVQGGMQAGHDSIPASKGSDTWNLLGSHLVCSGLDSGIDTLTVLSRTWLHWSGMVSLLSTTKFNHQFFIFLYRSM